MTPAAFFSCACPCGCTRLTKHRKTASEVLARRARCTNCLEPDHAKKNPAPKDKTEPSRPITPYIAPDPEDVVLDTRIRKEQVKQISDAAKIRWIDSLPEKFKHASLDDKDIDPKHKTVITRHLNQWKRGQPGTAGLVLRGSVGVGKTYLGVSYANAAINLGLIDPSRILFGTEAELLSSAANSTFSEVDLALKRLISPRYRMIIIDDVGRGTWIREDMRPKVFSLVFDAAYRENKVVVVTTNLKTEPFREYIGDGALDRLRSLIGFEVITITEGGSMREKITREALEQVSDGQ